MNNIQTIPAKTIVNVSKAPSTWFDCEYSMNIYRGCSHGCIYCDSRSSCFGNTEFDKIRLKENALEIIRNDLRRKVKPGVISTGAMSDMYNPLERKLLVFRHALELISAYNFGICVLTKSSLISRDIDILQEITKHSPVIAGISLSTSNDDICTKVEPNVENASSRFLVLQKLSENGIYSGVMLLPILPFISDTEQNIKDVVRKASNAGAKFIYTYLGMTLRQGSREYYYEKLDKSFVGVKEKYQKKYGNRYTVLPANHKKLWDLFTNECEKANIIYDMKAIASQYRKGYNISQLQLHDFQK